MINILNSLYVIRMVARTIHITEDQANWLDANAFNVSRLVRRIFGKIMSNEVPVEMFTKIKTKIY